MEGEFWSAARCKEHACSLNSTFSQQREGPHSRSRDNAKVVSKKEARAPTGVADAL